MAHPDLIVGTETGDDAAVWRLSDDRALVVTADFITPVVDDARTWGQVAACNSVSDIYAMGAKPLFALNLVAWNSQELPTALLGDVLAGAEQTGRECGFVTVGGHTVEDPEPKFGLAVVGEADPGRLLTNRGLRAGDALVLTKRLGTGVVTTAIKRGMAPASVAAAAVASMTMPNASGAAAALAAGSRGGTDVTGFGLLGHLGRMAEASGVDVRLDTAAIEFLPGTVELARQDLVPGGTRRNLDWVRDRLDPGQTPELTLLLLADAQTSGGLLFGVAADRATHVASALVQDGLPAAVVGTAAGGTGRIILR